MAKEITITIKRFDPGKDKEGQLEEFKIPGGASGGMTIIDALKYLQENVDPTLAFYYSCELAKCRGCVMDVNGKATFACTEPVQDGQRLEPLAHLPVIRDLVVRFIDSVINLDPALCSGCEACVEACPMDIYEMSESGKNAVVKDGSRRGFCGKGDAVDCIGCRRCVTDCPSGAITITIEEARRVNPR